MRALFPLHPELRDEKSRRVCNAIVALPEWAHARQVAMFAPQEREPDVELLWGHSAGKRFVYPRVDGNSISLFHATSPNELYPGPWGIREPLALPENSVVMGELDIILVPGVAFTPAGLRCGRGGGFYDRLLAALPAAVLKVGVCFAEQIVDYVSAEAHDIAVDLVISA